MPSATPTRRRPVSRVPRRWRLSRPIQDRSRETAERFAAAAEDLLRTRRFEEISIHDIVRRARRPIGSFYARFASKDALLPFLYERYDEGLAPLLAARIARVRWGALDFEGTAAALVDLMLGLYDERRWLIRAFALFARTRPESLPSDLIERRKQTFDQLIAVLLPHRKKIARPNPEEAIRFAVFVVASVAREKLLFNEAPHSRVTPITRTALRDELTQVLLGYLTRKDAR
jgi:AcrR family transcriptional regulator